MDNPKKLLLIDNFDSFTYNLAQYFGELGVEPVVVRNNAITVNEALAVDPAWVVISPGPCTPNESGVSLDIIEAFAGRVPLLGVCLGHQCLGQYYGGKIVRAERLMHGKTSPIHHKGEAIFSGLSSPFEATRYHSLIMERASLPGCLKVIAETEEGEIMAVLHETLPVVGVQFHPESIASENGMALLKHFLEWRTA